MEGKSRMEGQRERERVRREWKWKVSVHCLRPAGLYRGCTGWRAADSAQSGDVIVCFSPSSSIYFLFSVCSSLDLYLEFNISTVVELFESFSLSTPPRTAHPRPLNHSRSTM